MLTPLVFAIASTLSIIDFAPEDREEDEEELAL
jgi:hypothetical protein